MLPSVHRLPKEEITAILRRGIHVRGDAIELVYKKTMGAPRFIPPQEGGIPLTIARFTFVVSTKVDKRATQRNRMRRILSESVRHLLPKITPCDGVFIARKNIAEMSQVEAQVMVEMLLAKAGLLRGAS